MFVAEVDARKRWCPLARVDGNNRFNNRLTGGFDQADSPYHCLGSHCMMWREMHATHLKSGAADMLAGHGYCGLAGRPEFDVGA